ncbi:MAG: heme ABC exporter ATP-binding protein CcmA [Hyphomicrobiaceae bacterium]|nr:heme ABC exporter ATP-binding protein CcmA [Hyphomicrobiaceae bacterium]
MALVVDNLSVRRGERIVIAALSLRAERGQALLLTGPNGAGKTTLLRTIAGLLAPSEGSIHLAAGEGSSAGNGDTEVGQQCHFVGHLNGIKSSLSVAENARFWARYLGGPGEGVPAALDRLNLADLAPIRAGYLSAGQKRRLGLARLMLAPRPVWLLDEPAVSLDTASQGLLAATVNAHLADGGIVVAATHQPLGFAPMRELALTAGGVAP